MWDSITAPYISGVDLCSGLGGPGCEARRAEGGWGFWGGGQLAPFPPARVWGAL